MLKIKYYLPKTSFLRYDALLILSFIPNNLLCLKYH